MSAETTPPVSRRVLVIRDFHLGALAIRARDAVRRGWAAMWRREHLVLLVLIFSYVVWFSEMSLRQYANNGDPPFDMAIFDQGLWLLSHFHVPFVTVMGRNLFGDHTSFILLPVAVLYRLMPEPQGILVLQTVVIATSAIPVFLLSQRLIKNTVISTMLATTFLLNPAVQQGNMEQFHPEAFEVALVAWAIYAAYTRRAFALGVLVFLILMVKEDAAVYVIPLGLWVAWRRDRVWGAIIVGAGVAWTLVANYLIIPAIMGPFGLYGGRIPYGGWRGTMTELVRHPGTFWSYLTADGRPYYLWQMGFSTGWMFLIAPEVALIGVLALAENTISTFPYMHQILYHYSMAIVPALALGTVYAVSRLSRRRWQYAATVVVLLSALWSCSLWGLSPFSRSQVNVGWAPSSTTGRALSYLDGLIPPNAAVSAYYPLVAQLDHRTDIYMWPTPFSASNWGNLTHEGKRLARASTVTYLLLPTPLNPDNHPDVFNAISPYYTLVSQRDGFALYKRNQ